MGVCNSCNKVNNPNNINIKKGNSYIKCTYLIKDDDYVQIINKRGVEIESKIKILDGNQKENLIFKKKFIKKGINTIYFVIEEKLNDMSFMFINCSSLKQIEFISFENNQATNMTGMFQECKELEYLDLSNFNTINY